MGRRHSARLPSRFTAREKPFSAKDRLAQLAGASQDLAMRRRPRFSLFAVLAMRAAGFFRHTMRALLVLLWSALLASAADFRVLVFSKTAGFRHESIPAAITAVQQLGAAHDFEVVATEDAALFTPVGLAPFDAIVFLLTTGDVLDAAQQSALEGFIRAGGGWVAVHSASDTETAWPWYAQLVGAFIQSHHAVQPGTVLALDRAHPSTSPLPERWVRTDEWYNFFTSPRGAVHVLATLDESTVTGATMGHDHPIAWCHEFDGGRAWYTAMGHTASSYEEPEFRAHLLGGIQWAAGHAPGEAGATSLAACCSARRSCRTPAAPTATWRPRSSTPAARTSSTSSSCASPATPSSAA
jgi:type 1 glutamine amidotransferase